MRRIALLLIGVLAGCVTSSSQPPPDRAVARDAVAVIGQARAEFTFAREQSEIPAGATDLVWYVLWRSPGAHTSSPVPDGLTLHLMPSRAGNTVRLRDAVGRRVDVSASVGGEPPGAIVLHGPPVTATLRNGQLVFVVQGAANVAALFPAIPDSVMFLGDLLSQSRRVAVEHR